MARSLQEALIHSRMAHVVRCSSHQHAASKERLLGRQVALKAARTGQEEPGGDWDGRGAKFSVAGSRDD